MDPNINNKRLKLSDTLSGINNNNNSNNTDNNNNNNDYLLDSIFNNNNNNNNNNNKQSIPIQLNNSNNNNINNPIDATVGFLPSVLPHIPIDWSIPLSIRITSKSTFNWYLDSNSMDLIQSRQILNNNNNNNTTIKPSIQALFHSARYYYSYPATATDFYFNNNNNNNNTVNNQGNIREFESSFRSLYYSWRFGELQYFYYQTRNYTILFIRESISTAAESELPAVNNPGNNNSINFRAIISRSNRSFRDWLKQQRIPFTMPNSKRDLQSNNNNNSNNVSNNNPDISRIEQRRGIGSIRLTGEYNYSSEDNTVASVICITGRTAVHSLFDSLLNINQSAGSVSQQSQSQSQLLVQQYSINPQLYSYKSFNYSTLQSIQIKKLQAINTNHHSNSTNNSNNNNIYSLELIGPILPHNLLKFIHLFQSTQQQEFTIRFRHYLNQSNNNNNNNDSNSLFTNSTIHFNSLSNITQLQSINGFSSLFHSSLTIHPDIIKLYTSGINSINMKYSPSIKRIKSINNLYYIQLGTEYNNNNNQE